MSTELNEKIEKLLNNEIVDRHSYFQLKYFVIDKEPTLQSKLWRCLREIKSRSLSLNAMKLEIEELSDNKKLLELTLEQFEIDKKETNNKITEEINEINLRKNKRKITSIDLQIQEVRKKIKNTEEEVSFFLKAFEALEKQEALKPFDDFNSQTQYWNEKLTQDIHMKMILGLPMDSELIKTALCLEPSTPITKKVIDFINTVNEKNQKKELN